jgi:hypothetical protein
MLIFGPTSNAILICRDTFRCARSALLGALLERPELQIALLGASQERFHRQSRIMQY